MKYRSTPQSPLRLGASFSQVRIFPERPESHNSGVPLPQCMRSMMEAAFHADFSDIRVHQGAPDAKSLSALAFTQGRDIHFAPGQYSPDSLEGQKIIGHELAHVVQQQEGRVAVPQGQGAPINDDAALEAEADALGAKAAQGEVVRPAGSNPRGAFHPVAPVQRMKLDEEKKPGENGQGAYTRQDGETTEEFRSRMAIEMAGLRQSMAENDEIYPEDRDQDRPDWAEEFTDPKDWHSGKYFGDPNKLLGTAEEWEKPPEQEAPEVDKDKLAQHIGKRSEETQALQENWNINGEGRSQGRVHLIGYAYARPTKADVATKEGKLNLSAEEKEILSRTDRDATNCHRRPFPREIQEPRQERNSRRVHVST
jgi:hypothetical protein